MKKGKVIIVGGGLAGLMAAIKVAETGTPLELFSLVPVKDHILFVLKAGSMER